MTKSIRLAFCFLALLAATGARAEEERVVVTPKPSDLLMDLRLGIGGMLSPNLFAMTGSAEFRLDRFFSVGPMFQFGVSDNEQISVPSLAARFILPLTVSKNPHGRDCDLELSLHGGFGAMIRSEGTFDFEDFAFVTGFNADYFAIKELTVGMGALAIVTSSSVERSTALLYGSVGYHF
jgi:hypothetical protein